MIPTGAETLRLKGYLIMARNSAKDYADFAGMATSMDTETAASVLAGMDRYYCGQHPRSQWVATQLIRRLATRARGRPGRRVRIGRYRLAHGPADLPVRRRGDARGDEVTVAAKPAQTSVPTGDRPVEFWPTSAIRAALDNDDLSVWQRIATAIKRDPFGRTARQVEEVLETAQPYGVSAALAEVLDKARAHLEATERAEVTHHVRLLLERSGSSRTSSRPASACPPTSSPDFSTAPPARRRR